MVELEVLLAFQIAVLVLYCIYAAVQQWRLKRQVNEIMLHAPLMTEGDDHRLDAATSEAAKGFTVCQVCEFENFVRFVFCIACGSKLPVQNSASEKDKKTCGGGIGISVTSADESEVIILPRHHYSERQRRARRRREWIRVLNGEDMIVWKRDHTRVNTDHQYDDAIGAFTIRFEQQVSKCMHESQPLRDSVRERTSNEMVEIIIDEQNMDVEEAASQDLANGITEVFSNATEQRPNMYMADDIEFQALSVSYLDPANSHAGMLPLDNPSSLFLECNDTVERRREIVDLAEQDFPRKYVHFVVATAGLMMPATREVAKIKVSRYFLYEHSMDMMVCVPETNIGRTVFRITFSGENGVDAGGIHREWFLQLNEMLVDPLIGVFKRTDGSEGSYYLNASSRWEIGEDHLEHFYGAGRLVGRALLEGLLLGFHLSLPLLKIILGQPLTFSDLEHYDPEIYQSLKWILDHEEVDKLGLDFSIIERVGVNNEPHVVELIPNGEHIQVTDANKHSFVRRKMQYLLVESVREQLYAFLKGLYEVMPQSLLILYDYEELDFMLCGVEDIDVDDWKANTKYTPNLYGTPVMKWFWELVREMPNEYRKRLLQFATGSTRVPHGGFQALTSYDGRLSPFTLRGVDDTGGYIRSHACFNRLDLPRTIKREELKNVLYAILRTESYGFTTD